MPYVEVFLKKNGFILCNPPGTEEKDNGHTEIRQTEPTSKLSKF